MTVVAVVNPNTTTSMTQVAVSAAQAATSRDTEVIGLTSEMGPPSIESHYDEALALPGLLEIVASTREVDAFVVACFGDPGIAAAREVASVPVLGIAEVAMKTATLLGRSFSIVTTLARTVGRARDLVLQHGLERHCAGVHACDIPVLDLERDAETTYATLHATARRALSEDGSDALVLGCAGMADLPHRLQDALGVPVVDGVAAAATTADALIRQRLVPAAHGELAPPRAKAYSGMLSRLSPPGPA